ncbi:hypothetical protein, partial [Enterovibrio norvegicus]|uniref:hypothetical protein n=1 Tax=Enterovibrio norvegicus TaxID=188144 RepID=UPI001A7E14D8
HSRTLALFPPFLSFSPKISCLIPITLCLFCPQFDRIRRLKLILNLEVTMFEINPIKNRLADIAERANVLRGYL